jgi:protein tyrosine phosphatase
MFDLSKQVVTISKCSLTQVDFISKQIKKYVILSCWFSLFRYNNIVPYDHNRVILKNPIKKLNYINASWIENYTTNNKLPTFIAAQGPMPHTVPHFIQV